MIIFFFSIKTLGIRTSSSSTSSSSSFIDRGGQDLVSGSFSSRIFLAAVSRRRLLISLSCTHKHTRAYLGGPGGDTIWMAPTEAREHSSDFPKRIKDEWGGGATEKERWGQKRNEQAEGWREGRQEVENEDEGNSFFFTISKSFIMGANDMRIANYVSIVSLS